MLEHPTIAPAPGLCGLGKRGSTFGAPNTENRDSIARDSALHSSLLRERKQTRFLVA